MELLNCRSVDTICRDSADTQCIIIQKNSENLTNGKLIAFINLPFIFECFHDE